MSIHLVVTMQLQPGAREAFVAAFRKVLPAVLAEKGCLRYLLCGDSAEGPQAPRADTLTLIEEWSGEAELQAHLASRHMAAYGETVRPLRAAVTLRKLRPL